MSISVSQTHFNGTIRKFYENNGFNLKLTSIVKNVPKSSLKQHLTLTKALDRVFRGR